jgi:hypothetical protein
MLEIKTTVTRTNRRKNIRDGGLAWGDTVFNHREKWWIIYDHNI